jgi:hypothetical protein
LVEIPEPVRALLHEYEDVVLTDPAAERLVIERVMVRGGWDEQLLAE